MQEAESLRAHCQTHDFPKHISTCDACFLFKNLENWRRECVARDPASGAKVVWLCWNAEGKVGCRICRSVGKDTPLARVAAKPKLSNLRRHGNLLQAQRAGKVARTVEHDQAVREYFAGEAVAVEEGVVGREWYTQVTYAHFVFQRTLLDTGGSFVGFRKWCDAAGLSGVTELGSLRNRHASTHMTQAFADEERRYTRELLQAAAALGVLHDGRGNSLQVAAQGCLWKLPSGGLAGALRPGVRDLGGGGPDSKGPWVVWRLVALEDLGADHSAKGKAQKVCRALEEAGGAAHSEIRQKVRFCASDGANDARSTGKIFEAAYPTCRFQLVDPGHSHALVGKWATAGDEEIELVEGLLVNGEQSVSKFLFQSTRFRASFQEESAAECEAMLEHFGWAPQRRSSKARPLRNFAIRLRATFTAIAREAEESTHKDFKALARQVLDDLSGDHSDRLLLAGLMADYRWEMFTWNAKADLQHGDITTIQDDVDTMLDRLRFLFDEGMVLTEQGRATFTGAMLNFLQSKPILFHGRKAAAFEKPHPAAQKAVLNRMRAVVARTREYVKVFRPQLSWQNKFREVFRLPWPAGGFATRGDAAMYLGEICNLAGVPGKRRTPGARPRPSRSPLAPPRVPLWGWPPGTPWGAAAPRPAPFPPTPTPWVPRPSFPSPGPRWTSSGAATSPRPRRVEGAKSYPGRAPNPRAGGGRREYPQGGPPPSSQPRPRPRRPPII